MIVGREKACELVLDSPLVSRRHAELVRNGDGYLLRDLSSANGTFLDGRRIHEAVLQPGARIYIGNVRLLFDGRTLVEEGARGQVRVEVSDLFFRLPSLDRNLLENLRFTIEPGQFMAIVGTSGAGKSTLMSCLSAQRAPTSGRVLFNGLDAAANIDLFRSLIGYVPQDDIVHRELPVEAALGYAARLRLPPDLSAEERMQRVDTVIATMDLGHRRHNPVSTLSGGERKRVSMACELLTEPCLFFLDEPTSGLDPGMEKKAMLLMNRLARQGRTLILITHATQNIVLCDRVLLLAAGGRMVYYGPPRESLEHFQVDDFAEIYLKIDSAEKGQEWAHRFRSSPLFEKYVAPPKTAANPAWTNVSKKSGEAGFYSLTEAVRQFFVLSARYAHQIWCDKGNLALLAVQAPLIGSILALLFDPNLFALSQEWSDQGKLPIRDAPTVLFLLVVSSLFFGSINACREVVKELPILRRERLVNLQLLPYFFSKVAVLGTVGLVQTALLLLVVQSRIDMHLDPTRLLQIFGFLALSSLGGTLLGLLLSCISRSAEQASTLVSVILILQLALSGAFIKAEEMMPAVRFLSSLSLSRWAFAGVGSVANLNSRFMELHLGWITVDFYLPLQGVVSVLGGLLVLHALVALLALRWREKQQER